MSIVALIRVAADVLPKTLVDKYELPKSNLPLAVNSDGCLCGKHSWHCWPEEVEVDSEGKFHKLNDDKVIPKNEIVVHPSPEQRNTYVTVDTWGQVMVNLEEFLKEHSGEITIIKSIVTK